MEPIPFRIEAVKQELPDCFTLTLTPPVAMDDQRNNDRKNDDRKNNNKENDNRGNDNRENNRAGTFNFAPGQFNMLYTFGHGEVPISISGDPEHPQQLVHTIRNVGSVTAALQRLKPGDTVGVRGPFGSSWPITAGPITAEPKAAHKNQHILVVAGGLGLAPLRPALNVLLANADQYRSVSLLYGTRTPETILFADQLAQWSEKIDIRLTVDAASSNWRGHVGMITDLIYEREILPANTTVLLCGPEIMMRFCTQALIEKGLSASQLFLSMERNMQCAIGLCGRCQYGPHFLCKDGPVFAFNQLQHWFQVREL
jgi:NAD(P)H-flavin reductase